MLGGGLGKERVLYSMGLFPVLTRFGGNCFKKEFIFYGWMECVAGELGTTGEGKRRAQGGIGGGYGGGHAGQGFDLQGVVVSCFLSPASAAGSYRRL